MSILDNQPHIEIPELIEFTRPSHDVVWARAMFEDFPSVPPECTVGYCAACCAAPTEAWGNPGMGRRYMRWIPDQDVVPHV